MEAEQAEQSSQHDEGNAQSSISESRSFSDILNSFPMPPNHPSRRFGKSKADITNAENKGSRQDAMNQVVDHKGEDIGQKQTAEAKRTHKEKETEMAEVETGYEGDDEGMDGSSEEDAESD
jgi:hypothetical protein